MGNKNSGRRKESDKEKRLAIIDKAWDIVNEELNDVKVPRKDKIALSKDIVVRSMTQKIEGEGFDTNIYNFLRYLETTQRNNRGDLSSSLALDHGDGVHEG